MFSLKTLIGIMEFIFFLLFIFRHVCGDNANQNLINHAAAVGRSHHYPPSSAFHKIASPFNAGSGGFSTLRNTRTCFCEVRDTDTHRTILSWDGLYQCSSWVADGCTCKDVDDCSRRCQEHVARWAAGSPHCDGKRGRFKAWYSATNCQEGYAGEVLKHCDGEHMGKLAGRVAIVTGSSKGIGAAIAKHLGRAGAAVVVNYLSSKPGADRVVNQIINEGGKAVAVHADMTKQADIQRLFATAMTVYGRLDIVVNNAGMYKFLPIEEVTLEHFHSHFNLNVLGLMLCCKEAVKYFGSARNGSIINIASIVSTYPLAKASVYSATKAAVDAVTKSLSKELGSRNIRVNSISPGFTETEGFHASGVYGSQFHLQAVASTPFGRLGQPDDIARVAVFLASDDSAWVTGDSLIVSGGLR